ncbi:MAG TPA: DedA family protein [Jatrophihabitans sp.]|jgi:membrane-associated protein
MSLSALSPLASHVLANPISPDTLLSGKAALVVLAVILFAECGRLVGVFLPGDTLLIAAGISIATGTITTSITAFLVVAPLAAIAGNLLGYWIGRTAGPKVFDRPNSKLLQPENVERTHTFMAKWGPAAVIVGRFVPIVRTFITVAAGVGRMPFGKYALYSVIGGVVWADGVLILGDRLGHIKFVQDNKGKLDYVIVAVVIIALLPTLLHYLKARRTGKSTVSPTSD